MVMTNKYWKQEKSFHSFENGICTNCGITEKYLWELIHPKDGQSNALPYCRNSEQAKKDIEEYTRIMNKVDYPHEGDW